MRTCWLFLLFSVVVHAQLKPNQRPLPDEFFNRNDKNWYNRKTGSSLQFAKILKGEYRNVIEFSKTQLPDKEADFLLSIAYAHLKMPDSSAYYMHEALKHGVELSRYLGGDLPVIKPLIDSKEFQKIVKTYNPEIIHGPMVGDVTKTTAKIWLRTFGIQQLSIEVSTDESFNTVEFFTKGKTDSRNENTLVFNITGLQDNTRYYYRVITKSSVKKAGTFQTLGKNIFSIAFGACSAHIPWREHMWSTIHSHRPDAFFTLGDNVYIDYPKTPQAQLYCYHQRQSNMHWQKFVANTPTYAIWDDHDFGDNDDYGGLEKYEPSWKYDNWKRFQNQWANPSYGGGDEHPGVWFKKTIGDAEFFFLDGRYYREPSFIDKEKDHELTMLGPVQKAWLKSEILKSKAKFKVLISSVPWAFNAKKALEGKIDTWLGYPEERNEIFNFLTENKIEGVFLLSGDRHRADLWQIERENDYTLYEMEVGRLTNTHRHPAMPGVSFSYNEKDAFGKLNFDFSKIDPSVTYEIWSIDNEKIFTHSFKLSELK